MVTLKELNPKGYELTPEQEANLATLHHRINIIRAAYAKPMIVTSGVRSIAHHRRIYAENAKREGKTSFRIPMGSQHLKGAAVDILDRDGALMKWAKANESLLESTGLWCEEGTKGWLHFQIFPPRSGRRWFLP